MDILERKTNYDNFVRTIINRLKIEREVLKVKGSYSLASQQFYSDIDLYQNVNIKNPKLLYDRLFKVLEYIKSNDNIYFIELKFQNGKDKIKFVKGDKFNEEEFNKAYSNKTDYIKLDCVLYYDFRFIELSINYYLKFPDVPEGVNIKLIKEFKDNIKELKKDRQFYKILKREFSINKELGNKEELVKLTKFFNSDIGNYYQKYSNLEAIKLVSEHYNDVLTKKKIENNLKAINVNKKDINKQIKELSDYINESGLLFINKNNIKI